MKYILIASCVLFSALTLAQNEQDVLRYSFQNSISTARSSGMGGAFGGLGADLSSLSSNPAGLGLYRRGEFSFTTNFGGSKSNTQFKDGRVEANDFHFKLNSVGVISVQESEKINVNKVVFGVSFNRTANFNESFRMRGTSDNSLLDVFSSQATGIDYDNIYDEGSSFAILGWDAFLIDTISGTLNQYTTAIPFGNSVHDVQVDRNGGMGEITIGGAANISDRFYWGVSVGLPLVNFSQETIHRETPSEEDLDLEYFTYNETLNVSGSGANIKIGVILKPSQKLRLGAAVHTGTILSLTDNYSRRVTAKFKDESIPVEPDDFIGTFDYRIKTPGRLMANLAFIAGKNGVISADYEYIDYSNGKLKRSTLSGDTYNFATENSAVNQNYRETHNVRVGLELRVAREFRIRGGARYMQSPFSDGVLSEAAKGPQIIYNAGLGYRTGKFFLDLSGSLTERDQSYFAYSSALVDEAVSSITQLNVLTSVGWRF